MNKILLWIVFWTAAYWIAVQFIPVDFLRETFYITSVGVMFVVAVTWGKAALRILWRDDTTGPSLLILSVFLVAVVVLESRAIAMINFYAERPAWLYDSPLFGFIAFQITCVGYLQLRAVSKVDTKLPDNYRRNLWVAGLLGAFVGGFLLHPVLMRLVFQ